ncbi:12177_t:CDS:2, partial [Acaulospora colombiana]
MPQSGVIKALEILDAHRDARDPETIDDASENANGCANVRDNSEYQKSNNHQANEVETADFIPLVNETISEETPLQRYTRQTITNESFLSNDSELWTKFTPTSVLYIFHDKLRRKHPSSFAFAQDHETLKFRCRLMFGDRAWDSSLHSNKREAKHEVSLMAVRDLAVEYPLVLGDMRYWFEEFESGADGCASPPSNLTDGDSLPNPRISHETSAPRSVAPRSSSNPESRVSDAELIWDHDRGQAHESSSPHTSRDRIRFHPYIDTAPSILNALKATSLLYEWCSKQHRFSGPAYRNKKDAKEAVSRMALEYFRSK